MEGLVFKSFPQRNWGLRVSEGFPSGVSSSGGCGGSWEVQPSPPYSTTIAIGRTPPPLARRRLPTPPPSSSTTNPRSSSIAGLLSTCLLHSRTSPPSRLSTTVASPIAAPPHRRVSPPFRSSLIERRFPLFRSSLHRVLIPVPKAMAKEAEPDGEG
ncbi:hypothetical protein R6Q59_008999 [Mikania micrantha]